MSAPTSTSPSRAWLALASALGLLAVVVGLPSALGGPAGPTPAEAADPEVPAVEWGQCSAGFEELECASFPVPVDHADPFGPEMHLAVMRLPANGPPEQRIGSMFVNPGGPGASALDFLVGYVPKFSEELRARFDIVAFNPRGVVASSPSISCPNVHLPSPTPDDWEAYFGSVVQPTAAASTACQLAIARTGPYYGTNQVVQDLDMLRAAVGDAKLSYWGVSYGTRIGEVYAQRYPDRVRAMILDGNVDPQGTLLGFSSEKGGSFDAAFDFFLSVYPEVAPAFAQVSEALAAGPMEVVSRLSGETVDMSAQAFYTQGIMSLISFEAIWPTLASEIQAMAHQILGGPIATVTLQSAPDSLGTLLTQVNCLDYPQRSSVEVMSATAAEMTSEGPLFGEYVAQALSLCAGFPLPADPVPAVSPSASELPPVLLFGSQHDPATPYRWSQDMNEFLPGSVLATYGGAQHGIWNLDSRCINSMGDAYMINLELPRPGVTCPFVEPGSSGPTPSP